MADSIRDGVDDDELRLRKHAARFGDEAVLFRLAAQLEAERPWKNRLPPTCA